jgi:XapX domain-containing protein
MAAAIIGLVLGLVIGPDAASSTFHRQHPALDWSVPLARDHDGLRYGRPCPATGENPGAIGYTVKSMIGNALAFALGFACRAFGIPSSAPPLILGASLVMTMTIGYIAVDRWMALPARHAPDCAGPSGLAASQALSKSAER